MELLENEAKIILMTEDNDGRDLSSLNREIITTLTNAFGGATITQGAGTWVDGGKLYQDKNLIVCCNYSGISQTMLDAFYKAISLEFSRGGQLAVSVSLKGRLIILDRSDLSKLDTIIKKFAA